MIVDLKPKIGYHFSPMYNVGDYLVGFLRPINSEVI